ncbi:MAG TPA: SusC/RagA family TonB-linked outer membrane protein [Vicingaceae bacterium]|nr:SusC/RagA family TonB-linked outer membrane protein [Vicingaceae bacterium]
MRSKFTWILTLFFALIVQAGFAQKPVTGVVKTQDGEPIPGATVMLVGTNQGTDTDDEGKYTLNLKKGDKIQVVYEGFKSTTVTATDSGILNVTLVEDDEYLIPEIIVTQYRTVAKEKDANAVSTVTSKTIEGRPNASFIQTLQGQVPGLNIATGSGQPGSNDTSVILRGAGSINGNIQPLYVIDGVPMSSDRFRSLNPNDIESVTVLKDAGATAIYGNRGANGVIDVKTKTGSFDSALSVKYVGTTGIATSQSNGYNLMSTSDYSTFLQNARRDFPTGGFTDLTAAQKKINTDWFDVFLRDAITQTHTLSFTGGSKNLSSFTSVGYADYEGLLKNTGLKRFNFRSNLNGKNDSDRLHYGTNISANYSSSNQASSLGTAGVNQNIFMGAFQSLPYLDPSLYTGTGASASELFSRYGMASMPYLLMDKARATGFTQNEFKMLVNGNISYKLTDELTLGNNTGIDYQTINQNQWNKYDSFNEEYFYGAYQYKGWVYDVNESRMVFNSNTSLRYSNTWNDVHSFSAGAYLEYIKAHYKDVRLEKRGFDPVFWSDGGSTGWVDSSLNFNVYSPVASMLVQNAGLFSYFGNASYDYDSRYGVEATLRRDASFRFTGDNRWGTFWSVSGRWNISNEKFMEGSVFNTLKLRGSYGTTGNQDIVNSGMFGGANLFDTQYRLANLYNGESGVYVYNLPNPSLQWEVVSQGNIGLDFGVWNNRLRGAVDVYKKQTDDLYQTQWVSAINGATRIPANFGSLKNEGIELNVSGDVIKNENTRLTLNFNGAYNKNTVLEIPSEEGWTWDGQNLYGLREGGMVNEFYMYRFSHINPDNGNMLFIDRNGNLTEEPQDADRQFLNKSALPIYQGGFGIDFEHKGWFVNANFTYALDVWRFDNEYYFYTNPSSIKQNNLSNDYNDYWSPTNRDASFPKLSGSNYNYAFDSDFYIKDASYVRLRYVSVGYNFKKKDLDFLKLSGLRVYAQGENLHTWTKWKGFDAESNRTSDFGQYPTPKTYSFGVEVSF